ncbi:hypothetical protein IFM89_023845 [Coptis chinensis]|uniref:Uncharacterized protein n=1 Tax=Coptis chinensis TaxID=261450 RepID=A0A835IXH3_9MAGN|nr:hypothetical protein IFM89_023845 [Coptis chinensis]
MQGGSIMSLSPSFNSYSSKRFAEIAAKVTEEFSDQLEELGLEEEAVRNREEEEKRTESDDGEEEEDDDFEFAVLCRDPNTSPISADEIFSNGQIKPIYPVFNRDLLFAGGQDDFTKLQNGTTVRLPLRKLLTEERDPTASSSSSEADELEALPDGTYCVWTPKPVQGSPELRKKSKSTGSSKRWRFRDLLHRSNSDGKDTFVFLAPSIKKKEKNVEAVSKERRDSISGKGKSKGEASSTSAHEAHYMRNRAIKESDRRRSYLPYRQDLVGFFANVNGLNRTLRPF